MQHKAPPDARGRPTLETGFAPLGELEPHRPPWYQPVRPLPGAGVDDFDALDVARAFGLERCAPQWDLFLRIVRADRKPGESLEKEVTKILEDCRRWLAWVREDQGSAEELSERFRLRHMRRPLDWSLCNAGAGPAHAARFGANVEDLIDDSAAAAGAASDQAARDRGDVLEDQADELRRVTPPFDRGTLSDEARALVGELGPPPAGNAAELEHERRLREAELLEARRKLIAAAEEESLAWALLEIHTLEATRPDASLLDAHTTATREKWAALKLYRAVAYDEGRRKRSR
jgi:hypothetical protein